ncbi:hypothetical protein [Rhizobium sp. RAF56]|uniref:hypothetical protein n=1 Tax=Rhizobium sp. RAF56 TaxID=3233062 RepID=UPI003F989166
MPEPPARCRDNEYRDAMQAVPLLMQVGNRKMGIPKITLSKRELIEQIGVELDAGTLRIAQTGEWEELRHELTRMQRIARQSGSVAYQAAPGEHDDLVSALSLTVYGCRRFAPQWRAGKVRMGMGQSSCG